MADPPIGDRQHPAHRPVSDLSTSQAELRRVAREDAEHHSDVVGRFTEEASRVVRDFPSGIGAELSIVFVAAHRDGGGPSSPASRVWTAHILTSNRTFDVLVHETEPTSDRVTRLARAVQDIAIESTWKPMPSCPNDAVPLEALAVEDEPRWKCPSDGWSCVIGAYGVST